MPAYTNYFHLEELLAGDAFSTNGYSFSIANIIVIDALLYAGTTGHHHDGLTNSVSNPSAAPGLTQSAAAGTLPPATTIYYEYTFVNPIGLETALSPVGSITTPNPISPPGAPIVSPTLGTGTNPAGSYSYVLTYYQGTSLIETLNGSPGFSILTAEGENGLSWATPPSGATGVNIYVLQPGGTQYLFLTSSTGTSYTDNGSVGVNCNRSVPSANTTNTVNEVTVIYQPPPGGWTVNLYRTFISGSWGGSQIQTGLTGTSFTDTGVSILGVTPPTASTIPNDPSKVLLTGAAEVQGILPMANLQGFPYIASFSFPGPLTVENGISVWTCETTSATIASVRASLGVGHTPAANPVIIDVQKGPSISGNPPIYTSVFAYTGTPTALAHFTGTATGLVKLTGTGTFAGTFAGFAAGSAVTSGNAYLSYGTLSGSFIGTAAALLTLYNNGSLTAAFTGSAAGTYQFPMAYPEVPVGDQVGTPVIPFVTGLLQGDTLVADILQVGGGITPTDAYLTVDILLYLVP